MKKQQPAKGIGMFLLLIIIFAGIPATSIVPSAEAAFDSCEEQLFTTQEECTAAGCDWCSEDRNCGNNCPCRTDCSARSGYGDTCSYNEDCSSNLICVGTESGKTSFLFSQACCYEGELWNPETESCEDEIDIRDITGILSEMVVDSNATTTPSDDDNSGDTSGTCNVGVCINGDANCDGIIDLGCPTDSCTPKQETCNGIDDDCDEIIDDGACSKECSEGGRCSESECGLRAEGNCCYSKVFLLPWWGKCEACEEIDVKRVPEVCNGIDDDNDNIIDEDCKDGGQCITSLSNGDMDYCRDLTETGCGCEWKESDCDNNNECKGNLVCKNDINWVLGFDTTTDICCQPYEDLENGKCVDNRLGEGQGDCESDKNCREDLHCSFSKEGNGDDSSWIWWDNEEGLDYCCKLGTEWDGEKCSTSQEIQIEQEKICVECDDFWGCSESKCLSLGNCCYQDEECHATPCAILVEDLNITETCFDGILNQNEKNVDCGGACESCEELTLSVEDSANDVRVYRQIGDLVTFRIFSMDTTDAKADYGMGLKPLNCQKGTIQLSRGYNECKFQINERTAEFTWFNVNGKMAKVYIRNKPQSITITNRDALFARYGESPEDSISKVYGVLKKAFEASEPAGIVYYLDDYNIGTYWNQISEYNEKPGTPEKKSNSEVSKISQFVASRCKGNCQKVKIIGDDFVVPHERRGLYVDYLPETYTAEYPARDTTNSEQKNYIYTDIEYIPKSSSGFYNFLALFENPVKILVPDEMDDETEVYVNLLEKRIRNKYSSINIEKASEYTCSSVGLASYTLVMVGNSENNRLINCLRFNAGSPSILSVERSIWGAKKFAIVLYMEENLEHPHPVIALSKIIDEGPPKEFGFSDNVVACLVTGDFRGSDIERIAAETTCNIIPIVELMPDIRDTIDCISADSYTKMVASSEECKAKTKDMWYLYAAGPAIANTIKGSMCSDDPELMVKNAVCPIVYIADVLDVAEAITIFFAGAGLIIEGADAPLSAIKTALKHMSTEVLVGFIKTLTALPKLGFRLIAKASTKCLGGIEIVADTSVKLAARMFNRKTAETTYEVIAATSKQIPPDAILGIGSIKNVEYKGVTVEGYMDGVEVNVKAASTFSEGGVENTLTLIEKEIGLHPTDLKIKLQELPTYEGGKFAITSEGPEIIYNLKFSDTLEFKQYDIYSELSSYFTYKSFGKSADEIVNKITGISKQNVESFLEVDNEIKLLAKFSENGVWNDFVSFANGIYYKLDPNTIAESVNTLLKNSELTKVAAKKAQLKLLQNEVSEAMDIILQDQKKFRAASSIYGEYGHYLEDLRSIQDNIPRAIKSIDNQLELAKESEIITSKAMSNINGLAELMVDNAKISSPDLYEFGIKKVGDMDVALKQAAGIADISTIKASQLVNFKATEGFAPGTNKLSGFIDAKINGKVVKNAFYFKYDQLFRRNTDLINFKINSMLDANDPSVFVPKAKIIEGVEIEPGKKVSGILIENAQGKSLKDLLTEKVGPLTKTEILPKSLDYFVNKGVLTTEQAKAIQQRMARDFFFGQIDRRLDNILITKDGKVVFFDNERSLASFGSKGNLLDREFKISEMFEGTPDGKSPFPAQWDNFVYNELSKLWKSGDEGKKQVLDIIGPELKKLETITKTDFDGFISETKLLENNDLSNLKHASEKLFGEGKRQFQMIENFEETADTYGAHKWIDYFEEEEEEILEFTYKTWFTGSTIIPAGKLTEFKQIRGGMYTEQVRGGFAGTIKNSDTGQTYYLKGGPIDMDDAEILKFQTKEFNNLREIEISILKEDAVIYDSSNSVKIINGYKVNGIELELPTEGIVKVDALLSDFVEGTDLATSASYKLGTSVLVDIKVDEFIKQGVLTNKQVKTIENHFLLDYWRGQWDRDLKNIFISKDGKIIFIDNELALDPQRLSPKIDFDYAFGFTRPPNIDHDYLANPVYQKLADDASSDGMKAVFERMRPSAEYLKKVTLNDLKYYYGDDVGEVLFNRKNQILAAFKTAGVEI